MTHFIEKWTEAVLTTAGFFWMAFWAFSLGYLISSAIQVFVTRERMKQAMGTAGVKSVGLATFFGFISSSCSFAALATSKSLFQKGAGLVPALAFLLASTNLVIELGIIIAVFLSWQFVVAEYLGGLLLICCMWLVVRLTLPNSLEESARANVGQDEDEGEVADWKELIRSLEGWQMVAKQYFMEWQMVWKDVVFGFTVAGIISAFVPRSYFEMLFVGAGTGQPLAFWEVCLQTLIGPVAAFFTFIGSMGNIPLAALLYQNGVSFAGVMAFIFSDLVVLPVLRINAQYFGWRMAFYILAVFLVCLTVSAISLHYSFELVGMLPKNLDAQPAVPENRFAIDYTFFLNVFFVGISGILAWLRWSARTDKHSDDGEKRFSQKLMNAAAWISLLWLLGGGLLGCFS